MSGVGVTVAVPDGAIALAVEDARLKRRVATRKYYGNPRKLKDWYVHMSTHGRGSLSLSSSCSFANALSLHPLSTAVPSLCAPHALCALVTPRFSLGAYILRFPLCCSYCCCRRYKRENQKIQDELWAKLGKPNLPVPLKQRQHVETAGWLSPTPGSRSRSTSPWKWQPPTPERIRPGSKNDLYNLDAVLRSPDPTYPPPSMLATPPSAKASPDAPNTEGEAAPSTPAPADGNAGEAGSAVSPDAMASPDALAA